MVATDAVYGEQKVMEALVQAAKISVLSSKSCPFKSTLIFHAP
jgi:hypothetical protein